MANDDVRNPPVFYFNDPLFLHNNDNPGHSLVTNVFDGQNFNDWRISIRTALLAKNKLDFIDGTLARPAAGDARLGRWIRCNDMVKSWLTNSLNAEIRRSVIHTDSASKIWENLQLRFGQRNAARLFSVKQELNSLAQGSDSVSAYFTKMQALWDQISSLKHPIGCNCKGLSGFAKSEEEDRLLEFLMGLNESFKSVRGSILMLQPSPSIDVAYSLVLQEETQREIQPKSQISTESSSMHVQHKSPGSNMYGQQRGKGEQEKGEKKSLLCTHCIPSNYKENKNSNGNSQKPVQGERFAGSVQPLGSPSVSSLTPELISQLLSLLDTRSLDKGKEKMNDDFAGFAGSFYEEEAGDW